VLLAIDVGNTNISFGIFSKNGNGKRSILKKVFNIPTNFYNKNKLKYFTDRLSIDAVIICSVVPKITRILERDIKYLYNSKPYILGKNITVPIKNLYAKPKQVGQDRLVDAYAGVVFFGSPLIVIDFGTAITFDVVSRKGEYLGGMILPGLQLSLDALAVKTALLPKIKLSIPKEFIGKNTKASMLSGIVYGFAALTDDLSRRIQYIIGKDAKIIGTGGNIGLINRYCKSVKVDEYLTLKGLQLIYAKKALSFV